jgi:hypothetical protein
VVEDTVDACGYGDEGVATEAERAEAWGMAESNSRCGTLLASLSFKGPEQAK